MVQVMSRRYFNDEGEPMMTAAQGHLEDYYDQLSAQEYAEEDHYGDD